MTRRLLAAFVPAVFGVMLPVSAAHAQTTQPPRTTVVVDVDDDDDSDKTGLWGLAGLLGLLGLAGLAGRKRLAGDTYVTTPSQRPAPPTARGATGTDH